MYYIFIKIRLPLIYIRMYSNTYQIALTLVFGVVVLRAMDLKVAIHANNVHASGSEQLQANPHLAGPWLSPGKPTGRAVTTMGSNDLVVGEDHMLGPSCHWHNWKTGRCGSMTFGSSLMRGKTLISNPSCFADVSICGKYFRR